MKAFFAVPCLVIVAIILSASLGLRFNLSASMPAGIYRLQEGSPVRGDLVQFVFPHDCPFGVLARERGYLGRPESPYPLLKRVSAVACDLVEISPEGVRVNGVLQPDSRILEADSKGRPTRSVLKAGTVPEGLALLLAPSAKSFDGRYFGFVSVDRLQRVIPLITFNQEIAMIDESNSQFEYLDAAARQVDIEASENPGAAVEVDPDVAEFLGAFEETGLTLEEALDAAILHDGV